ncbi:YheC/YheD family protein [Evansella sp. LMS18]|uniref:YheC/YheD family endospore coat-associated protein n=1 Tax=Evansella sp. LMS18 TaxID=2924033 RepID=UPI0020D087C2|nr:YheC/YheD family protein [Evansella sp. LMS18]UTR09211.1 YheC/YheD family protein [Evansella sp. LMS18]
MSFITEVSLNELEEESSSLLLSRQLLDKLSLKAGSEQYVFFGTKKTACTINIADDENIDRCLLSKKAWKSLSIPFPVKLNILSSDTGDIYLGPVVGIYTAGFTGNLLRPAGERSFLFAKYISAAKAAGVLAFIFGSHHLLWEEGTVEGYTYGRKGWKKIKVPLPNVVYDRLPNRKTEEHPLYAETRDRLQNEYSIPWFNPGFFDKWTVYNQLSGYPMVSSLMPRTISAPSAAEVKEFIEKYKHIYIKPKNGSLGLGIHQIIFDPDEQLYYCRFRDHSRNRLRRYGSLHGLLKTQFPHGYEDMVIQQGIDLLKYQNNPIDFRIHTNKDETGKWRITAIAAKVAGAGSVTTHVKSGGQVKSVHEIWEELQLGRDLLDDLKNISLKLSTAIDETTDGYIGEIGFDIGIDGNENIWMFEANSKPGRTIFLHPKLKREDLLTRKLPMDYAVCLFRKSVEAAAAEGVTM